MTLLEKKPAAGGHGLAEVEQAAISLQGQACTLSARHIQDGMLRLQFNREIACFAQGILEDVKAELKDAQEGLDAITAEIKRLSIQSFEVGKKVVGVAAGTAQIATGAGVCTGSGGTLCLFFGIPLVSHGVNNIYENGHNLIGNRTDTEGWVRKQYQGLSVWLGGTEHEGNMAYGAADLGLSFYGSVRLIKKPDAWRLWRYTESDKVRAYKNTSKYALGLEAIGDGATLHSLHEEKTKQHE